MGKSWKNPIKVANAQKKGAIFTKLAREIQVAAKMGGADLQFNSRLRMAVEAAKKAACPSDTIDRAIKKGSGQLDGGQIEEILYEGFGPHGVGVLLECQTDNRHRTAPEVRNLFKTHGGQLGEAGSVTWMFERVSSLSGFKEGGFDPEEEAIEAGANEVSSPSSSDPEGGGREYCFYGDPTQLDSIRQALIGRGWHITEAELTYKAKNPTTLNEVQQKEVLDFLEVLDDHDDTHRVHATIPS